MRQLGLTPFPVRLIRSHRRNEDTDWGNFRMVYGVWRCYATDCEAARLDFAGESCVLDPAQVYLIPAHFRYKPRAERAFRLTSVHFDLPTLSVISGSSWGQRPHPIPATRLHAGFRSELDACCQSSSEDLVAMQRLSGLMHTLIASWLEQLSAAEQESVYRQMELTSRLGPALELIHSQFHRQIRLAEIATSLHVSPDHATRLFKSTLQTTPSRYTEQIRLRAAATQLLDTDLSIEAIAEDTGFGNRYYLSRVFKRHYDQGPAAFRRRNQ